MIENRVEYGSSMFFQPKLGISSSSTEVYIAGCCSGVPVILTKTLLISPRQKPARNGVLDAIPEDEAIGKKQKSGNGSVQQPKLQITEVEVDDYGSTDQKIGCSSNYPEDIYFDEDGQLSWFNAGVRVGVGIGLGMCVGVGLGIGLLMRSYDVITSNARRRFF